MRVRTGWTRDVSLMHRCLHPGSLTHSRDPSTTADCVRPRQPGSVCDSVLGDRQGRGSPGGNARIRLARYLRRRAESDQGSGGEVPQGHRRNHPCIAGGTGGHHHGTGRIPGSLHCEGETPAQQADLCERTRSRAALQGHRCPRTSEKNTKTSS